MSAHIIYCDRAQLLHGPNLCLPIVLTSGTNEADVSTWGINAALSFIGPFGGTCFSDGITAARTSYV